MMISCRRHRQLDPLHNLLLIWDDAHVIIIITLQGGYINGPWAGRQQTFVSNCDKYTLHITGDKLEYLPDLLLVWDVTHVILIVLQGQKRLCCRLAVGWLI